MTTYEYKVIPSPTKGKKARGVKGPEGRFAFALESALNDMAVEGWQYLRAETLPNEERVGLTGSQTSFRTMLVFRRPKEDDLSAFEPRLLESPAALSLTESAPQPPSAETESTDAVTDVVETEEQGAAQEATSEQPEPLVLNTPVESDTADASPSDTAPEPEEGDAFPLPLALRNRARALEDDESSTQKS